MAASKERQLMPALSPTVVLQQVSDAVPESCRPYIIIIGSLAAGYHYFGDDGARAVRTKDVDAMFSPNAKAIGAAREVTEALLQARWVLNAGGDFSEPGNAETPDQLLPLVRLKPPDQPAWFLELLGAPRENEPDESGRRFERIETTEGHFALCSFGYLALAEWKPLTTPTGLQIARPEMMALANLLHHPRVGHERMSGNHFGTAVKRSNKDLGRVLALAYLQVDRDQRHGTAEFDGWAQSMAIALEERFPARAASLAARAGDGLRAMLASTLDFDEAVRTCNRGLLATKDVAVDALAATGRRFTAEVIEPLAARFA